jgi:hypothetical protein
MGRNLLKILQKVTGTMSLVILNILNDVSYLGRFDEPAEWLLKHPIDRDFADKMAQTPVARLVVF